MFENKLAKYLFYCEFAGAWILSNGVNSVKECSMNVLGNYDQSSVLWVGVAPHISAKVIP